MWGETIVDSNLLILLIQVGKEDETTPFMSWTNTEEPFVVSHYAFTTGWGSGGSWMFDKVGELRSSHPKS